MRSSTGRQEIWERLTREEKTWDLLIIGGGITGAGILREAARHGLSALVVEQRDFGWGASSRSSSVIHGGFRYLFQGQFHLTRTAVRGRQELLESAPGLVDSLGFLALDYGHGRPWHLAMDAGLTLYDTFAGYWWHKYYKAEDFQVLAPDISHEDFHGGFQFYDAQTDDARLVWRVMQEGIEDGGAALNYARVESLLREDGRVVGARVCDQESDREAEVRARVVVNAAGAWSDHLREQVGGQPKVRPLRGSHLLFPSWRVPAAQALTIYHPYDGRPIFVLPWQGATLVGTTDLDHDQPMDQEPRISPEEVTYLMAAVEYLYPSLRIGLDDVIATYAGVRPVVATNKDNPSAEPREYAIWEEQGLVTATGGKLTTFHTAALELLELVRDRLPNLGPINKEPVFNFKRADYSSSITTSIPQRLLGRYGHVAADLMASARDGELERIAGTQFTWAELRWSARNEAVVHLDDLLLRRVRVGLFLPMGGEAILPRVRVICQEELGWDDSRWAAEQERYLALWNTAYALPERESIRDWHELLDEAMLRRQARRQKRGKITRLALAGGAIAGAALALTGAKARRQAR
jgi:glycerol-3-phosphate dehydrogenase